MQDLQSVLSWDGTCTFHATWRVIESSWARPMGPQTRRDFHVHFDLFVERFVLNQLKEVNNRWRCSSNF